MKPYFPGYSCIRSFPISMIPGYTTQEGRHFAKSRLEPLTQLANHVIQATEIKPTQITTLFSLRVNPKRLDKELLNQVAETVIRDRNNDDPSRTLLSQEHKELTSCEWSFFTEVLNGSEALLRELDALTTEKIQEHNPRDKLFIKFWNEIQNDYRWKGWNRSTIGNFFGLGLPWAVEATRLAAGLEVPMSFDHNLVELVGTGVLTSLRVYLGLEKLGSQRKDLLPHKVFQVEDVTSGCSEKASRQLFVGYTYSPIINLPSSSFKSDTKFYPNFCKDSA